MREGLTFDDVLLQPKFSAINSRKDVSTKTKLTRNITLNIPIVSANMDTVTEAAMSIRMAEMGGIGIIHRFLTIENQVKEVIKVKRAHNFIIQDPYTIHVDSTVYDVKYEMRIRGVNSLLVVDSEKKMRGIITTRDLLFEDNDSLPIIDLMTPLEKVISKQVNHYSEVDFEDAKKILKVNKLEKLPLVDENQFVKGLITVKDIHKRLEFPNAVKDEKGRLLVGAAIGVKNDYLERTSELIKAGVDVLVIDIAHGHAQSLLDTLYKLKSEFPNIDIIAGNVASKHGTLDLISAGADAVKCGVGPGCFASGTRVLMANGTYQNIEDIKIGDSVINMNGKPVKVTNAFSTGIRKVSKLRNSIFYKDTYVTPDHRYWIGDLNSVSKDTIQSKGYANLLDKESKTTPKESKYKWKSVENFNQDTLLTPKNIEFEMQKTFSYDLVKRTSGNNNSTNEINYELDFTLKPSYEMGYILGTFLGDGNADCHTRSDRTSLSGKVVWAFGLNESEIAEKLQNIIYKTFSKDVTVTKTENTTLVNFYYKPFADLLNTFGKRTEKHLPEQFIVNDSEYLKGIIDGLIDSDGNIEEGGTINLKNTSVKIIELFNIASYLVNGVFPNNSKVDISVGNLKGANIENLNQCYKASIINTGEKRLTENYQVAKLLELTETEIEVPVYDITVDCDTHSFIANNAIVHNSTCQTRIVTGSGVPQLTAIMDCCEASIYKDVPLIADGGVKYSGDIVKALAAGASSVMLGGILAGCEETPGKTRVKDGQKFKAYRGMASYDAAESRGKSEKGYEVSLDDYVPEGVETVIPYKGKAKEVVDQLMGGLRSGMSYLGVDSIEDMPKNADFIKMSPSGLYESKPHVIK